MDVDKLMDETNEHYQKKFDQLHQESKQLRKANSKLKNEVRALKRSVHKLKQEKQKNHYKNGRRGSKFNG
ncbi:hypothetical protein ACJ2A9_21400 [Anaerobacillus sp. MEB173]|uniref:hypothetical protein n=1 Tax=Anaerobacillus sp. MEB173 TaxID=3383345 RepID=UPI003F8DDF3F